MKSDPLHRLFKSAAGAQRDIPDDIAFPTQARILAAWRASRRGPEAFLPLLRKAILAAGAVTVLALAFTFVTIDTNEPAAAEVDELVSATNFLNEAIDLVANDEY
jgi:hypothetical protein